MLIGCGTIERRISRGFEHFICREKMRGDFRGPLTVLEYLNIADDDLANVVQRIRRSSIERFENSAVVYE